MREEVIMKNQREDEEMDKFLERYLYMIAPFSPTMLLPNKKTFEISWNEKKSHQTIKNNK